MLTIRNFLLYCCLSLIAFAADAQSSVSSGRRLTEYVNPFIGTANYGTTNPGAVFGRLKMLVRP